MPVSMSQASLPALRQGLKALDAVLAKAEAHAAARKIEPAVLLHARLFPDMYPLVRQVQTVADFAKGTVARLAGLEAPSFVDEETTFAALRERIARTLDFLGSIAPEAIDGAETRTVTISPGGQTMSFEGRIYLLQFALPNFYFHLATAYNILRHNGVDLGKRDFIGGL